MYLVWRQIKKSPHVHKYNIGPGVSNAAEMPIKFQSDVMLQSISLQL